METEYISRIDRQIKIRGKRIEPPKLKLAFRNGRRSGSGSDIERKDGEAQLYTHYVGDDKRTETDIRADLARVPDYMIPQNWVRVERMPLTGNGKIDRSLPIPENKYDKRQDITLQETWLKKNWRTFGRMSSVSTQSVLMMTSLLLADIH